MSSKGQVVIPKDIRDRLGLKEGDRIAVEETEGRVVLRKISIESILKEAEEDYTSKKTVRLYPKSSGE
jgi:AbrB family looped-hinge helix DNA binding protein